MVLFLSIYWDPKPEIFILPIVHWPILWYGLFFASGFAVGFPIFRALLFRYFMNRPDYIAADLIGDVSLQKAGLSGKKTLLILNEAIENEKEVPIDEPTLGRLQILAEKSRCFRPGRALCRLILDRLLAPAVMTIERKTLFLTDRLTAYMVVATVIGARLGHFLFYESPSSYWQDPLEILRVWEGGLASHGAAVGIIVGALLFAHRYKKMAEGLNWIRLLDFICVPTAFAGGCIRLGNFFNQEILGTPTSLPWGVVFGHPMDRSLPLPRHPVQLYEAFFYFAVFVLLWRLSYRPRYLLARRKLIGLFLILVFGFRFFIEFLKTEQSSLHLTSYLTMGQILSIPAVLAGFIFFYKRTGS